MIGIKKKVWVGLRSIGREQTLATLCSIFQIKDKIEGLVISGELLTQPQKLLFSHLGEYIKTIQISGENPGHALSSLISKFQKIKPDYVLLLDDDCIFTEKVFTKVLSILEKEKDYDIVTLFPKREMTGYSEFLKICTEFPIFDPYFSLCRGKVFEVISIEELGILSELKRKTEWLFLGWLLLKKYKFRMKYLVEDTFHLWVATDKNKTLLPQKSWDEVIAKIYREEDFEKVVKICKEEADGV